MCSASGPIISAPSRSVRSRCRRRRAAGRVLRSITPASPLVLERDFAGDERAGRRDRRSARRRQRAADRRTRPRAACAAAARRTSESARRSHRRCRPSSAASCSSGRSSSGVARDEDRQRSRIASCAGRTRGTPRASSASDVLSRPRPRDVRRASGGGDHVVDARRALVAVGAAIAHVAPGRRRVRCARRRRSTSSSSSRSNVRRA